MIGVNFVEAFVWLAFELFGLMFWLFILFVCFRFYVVRLGDIAFGF